MSCGGETGFDPNAATCSNGKDDDGDGAVDFPDDSGCKSESDDEDNIIPPQCDDGRDNDGDGKHDYPNDPGCFAPNQDREDDDCPDGPQCPQCSNGKDDDENGATDFPNDSGGCIDASDPDEYTRNPVACGPQVIIDKLPQDGHIMGTIDANKPSSLSSMTCGGGGSERAYELRISQPKVVVATSDASGTTADTVIYLRSADCQNPGNELACNDDISATNNKSSITKAITTPGTYYLVVDAHDSASVGNYDVQVTYYAGEGTECAGPTDCGPGLVCRLPKNGTAKVCAKHVCDDNVDEDGDGKNGFPDDPGCTATTDDDESDSCPGVGPNCPECADGVDNDGDMKTDYGPNGDTTCTSASSASESCVSTDGVQQITGPATMGTTAGAVNDVKPACATTGTHTSADRTYRIDVPPMADLKLDASNMSVDGVVALYNSTCGGTAIQCSDTPETVNAVNLAAGAYYFVVDGYSTQTNITYTINVSGHIQNGASCESPLVTSGAITCANGYACKGTMGSRTCQPATCSDGIDNDGDTKIDFPFDPGCTNAADDTEADPATLPVCADNVDNDMDNMKDYPADLGCNGAGDSSEAFCTGETDLPPAAITTKTTTFSTMGKANDFPTTTCIGTTGPDVTYALQLPVPVLSLQIDTIGSSFDTVLQVRDIKCAAELICDDQGGGSNTSKLTMTNVSAGSYAVIVDGWLGASGAATLNVRGTVAQGTPCGSPLFSGGANAVLVCTTGTTCTGTPAKCQ